jgi:hypothetical protein
MDISTMLVDLLRGSEEEKILNQGGPIAKPAPRQELKRAGEHLRSPGYTAYRREAEASGEPVMSLDEYNKVQGQH